MSTILKALKKLEQERNGTTNQLSSQVDGREHCRPEASRLRAGVLLAGGLLLGALVVFGWFSWRGIGPNEALVTAEVLNNKPEQEAPVHVRELVKETSVRQSEAVTTAGPVIAVSPSAEPAAVSAEPIAVSAEPIAVSAEPTAVSAIPERSPSAEVDVSVIETIISAPEPVKVVSQGTEAEEFTLPENKAVSVELQQVPLPVDPTMLHVSAIFFGQDGGSMAVVDDLPVMEGMMVNDVLVEKIFADKIHFRIDGTLLVRPLAVR